MYLITLFCRPEHLRTGPSRFKTDGLNSVKYHIKEIKFEIAYTRIYVDFVPEEVKRNELFDIFVYNIQLFFSHFSFQKLGSDSKVVAEQNRSKYEPTLKIPRTTPMPIDIADDDSNVDFHGRILLSKIAESKNLNNTIKVTLRRWLIKIFKKLR